ncbi:MAG: diacylglycerol/polyprenol kinase family protein [Candidatus Geothermarchaeales archaeon]
MGTTTMEEDLNWVRLGIHLGGSLVPLFDLMLGRIFVYLGLLTAAAAYTASELLRSRGYMVPLIHRMTLASSRRGEVKGFVTTPLYLAAGVLASLALFPLPAAYMGVLLVTLGDGLAELFGGSMGRSPIPFNREKTWEGTLLGFGLTGVLLILLGMDPVVTIASTLAAGVLEALPLPVNDNLTVPLVAGFVAAATTVFLV